MKHLLVDIGHPAHVHLFRHLILRCREKGVQVTVTSRDKDVTNLLLDHYGIPYTCLSRADTSRMSMLLELAKRDRAIFQIHRAHPVDLAIGTSVSIAHLTAFKKVPSYVFEEDDDDVVPFFTAITYPFATGIVVPRELRYRKWRKKRVVHSSCHELAYLHPDIFSPDPAVPASYGLEPGSYAIVRLSALKAHHDVGVHGLTKKTLGLIISRLKGLRVITSRESLDHHEIRPWDMHHVLAFAAFLITDSQTMAMEAACLATPSIRCNSFVGRISYLEEAEHTYGLTYGFRPEQGLEMIDKVDEWMGESDLGEKWKEKRSRLLADKINFTDWMERFVRERLDG